MYVEIALYLINLHSVDLKAGTFHADFYLNFKGTKITSETENMWLSTMIPLSLSVNPLAFYHECRSLIGYATHYLFCSSITQLVD